MVADESTELTVVATSGNLRTITAFINQRLKALACPAEAKMQIDLAVEASKRKVRGLGIVMTKTLMDKVEYAYKDGKNILTLKKQIA